MTVQEVLALRVTLLHGGYSPLPLIGKAPALKEWQKRIDTSEGDINLVEGLSERDQHRRAHAADAGA